MAYSLSRIEARLQRIIEEGTARLFSANDGKHELAGRLIECMQAEIKFADSDQLVAPGIYTIYTAPAAAEGLKNNQALKEALGTALQQAANEANIALEAEPVLHVAPDQSLATDAFSVKATWMQQELSETQSLDLSEEEQRAQIPHGAFLIVGGTEIYPLNRMIINIGRKKDNQLVVDNPQVSRRHAQLRAIKGQYHFFDLGSTGGSKVNGESAKRSVLAIGDVISLAGVPLIYGSDARENASETQEFRVEPDYPTKTTPNPDNATA